VGLETGEFNTKGSEVSSPPWATKESRRGGGEKKKGGATKSVTRAFEGGDLMMERGHLKVVS